MVHRDVQELPDFSLAVVGWAGQFPDAGSVTQFWENIANGRKSIRFFSDQELAEAGIEPELLERPNYVKAGGVLEDVDLFDAPFFGFTPREAETMDPQSRLFIQCAWQALEDAAYDPTTYSGLIGVFAGKHPSQYVYNLYSNPEIARLVGPLQVSAGNDADALALMTAYKLNLRGPSISVQTFCSTSLVAVHLACQSLLACECDIALAGGSVIKLPQVAGYTYQEGSILSPDGECRALDASANGTVFGNGVAVVALKRLEEAVEDGDHIYAVVRGSAVCNDGIGRVGFTAPGVDGQAAAIATALGNAGVDAETIGYIETHGTGTLLGDSVELRAMIKTFQQSTDKKQFCAIGSVKPNVGHLDRASGVTGLIKAAMALCHKQLPPSLNFERPNPDIDLENSPFYVNTDLVEWESNGAGPRRAGVSSFGLGGTNAHVILEEAPEPEPPGASRPYQLLLLSAKSEKVLDRAAADLTAFLRENPTLNLADAAFTLQVGRAVFNHRRMVVCRDTEDAISALSRVDSDRVRSVHQTYQDRPVVFMFAGVGEHYVGLGQELYRAEPVFREWVDRCCALLGPHLGLDLLDVLYPAGDASPAAAQEDDGLDLRRMLGRGEAVAGSGALQRTELAQPAVFVVEYALAQLLMAWGIRPQALIGYSLGEYVAACVAGALSLEDALKLVVRRAQMIQALEPGAMLTVSLSEAQVQPFLDDRVALAGVLTPDVCVLGGPVDAVAALEEQLTERDVACRQLPTTHAFHTPMLAPVADAFAAFAQTVTLDVPRIPCISNVTGDWMTEETTDPNYWAQHLCGTVRLASGIGKLLESEGQLFVEVGPGQSLGSFVRQHPRCSGEQLSLVLPTLRSAYDRQSDESFLLNTLGNLWLAGVSIDWFGFYRHERRRRMSLPTYPFERFRYWVERGSGLDLFQSRAQAVQPESERVLNGGQDRGHKKPDIGAWFYRPVWEERPLAPQPAKGGAFSSCLVFCDMYGLGERVAERIVRQGGTVVRVTAGKAFDCEKDASFVIRPDVPEDYAELYRVLCERGQVPECVIHLWSVARDEEQTTGSDRFAAAQDLGYYSLIYLTQALGAQSTCEVREIVAVSNNSRPVTGTEKLYPEKATLFGVCRSILQECAIACRAIDLEISEADKGPNPALVGHLVAEVAMPCRDLEVAYRAEKRYVLGYETVELEKPNASPLRQGGTYVITGGLGGVGLILAEHLARTARANLVLIGRSPFPDESERDAWLASHPDADSVSVRIRKVQMIESLGVEVLVLQADVAEREQMERALGVAAARFGTIHGVIHAAGISDGDAFGAIQEIEKQQCESHFRPKVYGLYTLAQVLADLKDLDFCLLFSSLSSVLGGLGFTGYTAANIFMDVFARQHNRVAPARWISVNWDTWQLQAGQHDVLGRTVAEYEMTPAEGAAAFEYVLANDVGAHIVNSTGDLETRIQQWLSLESLQGGSTSVSGRARPDLPTAYVAVGNEYERVIAGVWQELLGIEGIGVRDNFFDLGGNSLTLVQMHSRLQKAFERSIPIAHLFQYPTIRDLAENLGETREERPALMHIEERGQRSRMTLRRQAQKLRRE
jgi:acyl transferase domain-containing protein/acyl carrier protein